MVLLGYYPPVQAPLAAFSVHAVQEENLPVDADTSAAVVGFMLHFKTVETATLMGLYKR